MLKKVLLLALVAGSFATEALAQQQPQRQGRDYEEKACGRDVSRFCKAVINESDLTILNCLQQNRPKISQACQKVLKDNGV
jgi:hypothetical protein